MEKINFSVDGNYAIDTAGKHVDLHNNFDFTGLEYSTDTNQVCLSWVKSSGDWIPKDEAKRLNIVFDKVSLLRVKGDLSSDLSTRTTLSFMGYLHPEDVALMDGCLDEQEANSDYHMIFIFEDGLVIKVFSDTAECKIS